jgi:hypothetical protein
MRGESEKLKLNSDKIDESTSAETDAPSRGDMSLEIEICSNPDIMSAYKFPIANLRMDKKGLRRVHKESCNIQ